MKSLIEQLRKTVVFLGREAANGQHHYFATGFIVAISGINHLVTAKHAVIDRTTGQVSDADIRAYFNLKSGAITSRALREVRQEHHVDWITHSNPNVDIAMTPFGLDANSDDVLRVPSNLFEQIDKLYETYPVFFLSYQPGVPVGRKITPVFRSGSVSTVNDDKTFYIDAAAFPGNSGSPVFVKPSPFSYSDEGDVIMGADRLGGRFVGLIGEYLPYSDVAISQQTGRARIVFEENTGLSKVWSVTLLQEIMASTSFNEQLKRILDSLPKPNPIQPVSTPEPSPSPPSS